MQRRNFLISVLAIFVQYYDYHLYGFLAVKIAAHFLPPSTEIVQILKTYFIMTIAMVAKPLGAIIFGKIGDIKGRSNSFALTLFISSIAYLVLFITPSYTSVGVGATIILLLTRMLICACVSSGSDGVRIYVYEHIDKSKKCLGVSITAMFAQAGSLFASAIVLLCLLERVPEYIWRFAFLLGSLMGLGLFAIIKITHFQDTLKINQSDHYISLNTISLWQLIKTYYRLLFWSSLAIGAIGATHQFIIIFFGTYNFKILQNIASSQMQLYTSIAIIIYMAFSILSGIIADKYGLFRISIYGTISIVIFTIILAYYLHLNHMNHFVFFAVIAALPFLTMPVTTMLKDVLPMNVRYRIFSLAHAIGSVLISAPTAYISTLIYYKTGITFIPLCYFILIILMISYSMYQLKNSHYKVVAR